MIYSKSKQLDDFTSQAYEELLKNGYTVIPESFKEIPYGVSFKIDGTSKKKGSSVAIYHTEKKGFSIVANNDSIRKIIQSLLIGKNALIGSDEAGKGDIFGPLVITAFYMCESSRDVLHNNIKDSKKISKQQIMKLHQEISKSYGKYFQTVKIMPERYNTFYDDLHKKGKTLNSMLSWAHGKAIKELVNRHDGIQKIVVDQYTAKATHLDYLQKNAGKVPVEMMIRGEKNPAVAVASIIARGEYLMSLKKLETTFLDNKITLLSGSGEASDSILQQISDQFGKEMLNKVCKVHFGNLAKIQ